MEATCHISLDAIVQNFRFFKSRITPAAIIPVVKANAYGHGAIQVARALQTQVDPELFAVATLEEAVTLAQALPGLRILIFSRVFPQELPQVPPGSLLSLGSVEDAQALTQGSTRRIAVHLNVNTGMNRLGLHPDQALALIRDPGPVLDIQGVYSHFSSSDTVYDRVYLQQQNSFNQFVTVARASGFQGLVHLANSAAVLHETPPRYDAMRLGIGLYGYDTSATGGFQDALIPAMEVKAPLIRVEHIAAGTAVSYAERWMAAKDTYIGTLRIGYADGYNRALTNRGMVSYQGRCFPVIGTVTMDHIMIDLGDEVLPTGIEMSVMGGRQTEHSIAGIARQLNTIPYEICCAVSPRVRRVHT